MIQRRTVARLVPVVLSMLAVVGVVGACDPPDEDERTVATGSKRTTTSVEEEPTTSTSSSGSGAGTRSPSTTRRAGAAATLPTTTAPGVTTSTTVPCTTPTRDTVLLRDGAAATRLATVRPDGSCLTLLSELGSHASWSPAHDRIALVSAKSGDEYGNLVVMKLDGSERRVLASRVILVAWSWAGDRLAFVDSDDRSNPRLWTIREDGTDKQLWVVYTTGKFPTAITWSPDDSTIAYSYASSVIKGLWTVSTPGGEPRQIHPSGSEPSWGRDGRILFVEYATTDEHRVMVIKGDGTGGAQPIGPAPTERPFTPMWSPDQTRILYSTYRPSQNTFSITPSGTDKKLITQTWIGEDW